MTHPWKPSSPCGPGCLPRRGTFRPAGMHRVVLRLSSAVILLLLGIGVVVALCLVPRRWGRQLIKAWFAALLRAFGVRLVVHDRERLGSNGALIVSNHVSWLDVAVLQAVCPMRLLAKTELRSWPVVGVLARRAGTLYIDRDRLSTLPEAVRGIADSLRAGSVVGAFPEGTTWCGLASGRYRPAVFQGAVDAGARVLPVAVRFRTRDGRRTTAAAFVGDETLVKSVCTVVRTRELVVELSVLPELDAASIADRRELARRAESAIEEVSSPAAPAMPHLPHLPRVPHGVVAA